jgi:hypothetical protein
MIGLFVVLPGLQSKRFESGRLFLAAAWLLMALYSTRNVPLFALVSVPLLAAGIGDWLSANHHRLGWLSRFFHLDQRLLQTDRSLRGFLWPLLALLVLIIGFQRGAKLDFQQRGNAFDGDVFPVVAMDWLEMYPQQGKVFNYFPWGGYMLYRDWPEQVVFIDGQTDFYGEDLTRQYEQVLTLSPGWEDVLQQYEVTWAIVPSDGATGAGMRASGNWHSIYRDSTAEIFSR